MSNVLMQKDVYPSTTGQRTIFSPLKLQKSESEQDVVQIGENQFAILQQSRPVAYKTLAQAKTRIYYVNGMKTRPSAHYNAARHLATIANQDVVGVFCPTMAKGLGDAVQVVFDYTLPVGRGMNPVQKDVTKLIGKAGSFFSNHPLAESAVIAHGKSLLWSNPASRALFVALWHAAKSPQQSLIVCHSQGNLITANALWVLRRLRAHEPSPMGNVVVLGLASPNPSWPPEHLGDFKLLLFRDKEDPITALSLPNVGRRPVLTPNEIGATGLGAHGVHLYMAHNNFQSALHDLLVN